MFRKPFRPLYAYSSSSIYYYYFIYTIKHTHAKRTPTHVTHTDDKLFADTLVLMG